MAEELGKYTFNPIVPSAFAVFLCLCHYLTKIKITCLYIYFFFNTSDMILISFISPNCLFANVKKELSYDDISSFYRGYSKKFY